MGARIKKRKLEIVFDEKKRREFLTGFRKRKQDRRKKAREDLDIQVKEEQKRIKAEIKEGFRDQMKKSFAPIPELADELNEEEFETEEVSVTITELSTSDLAKSNNWIGQNRPKYSEDEAESESESEVETEEVPGMGLATVKPTKKPTKSKTAEAEGATEATDEAAAASKYKIPTNVKSKRELGVVVQKDALRTLKNSKAFQQKERLKMLMDRKRGRKIKENRIKIQEKKAKRNNGHVNERKIKRRMKLKRKGKK